MTPIRPNYSGPGATAQRRIKPVDPQTGILPIAAHRANHTKIDLRQVKGGIVEIWRDDELLGMIQPTKSGFRLVMGDVDPDRHSTLFWGGEPFSIQFEMQS